MSKKVLLLGGTGAIGEYLITELLDRSFVVDVTSRSNRISSNKSLNYIQGDALDDIFLDNVLNLGKYDVVIDFMNYKTDNFKKRCNTLLKNCRHYIFLSSYRVFADAEIINETSPRILDVSTDKKYLKTDEYALAKARQENVLRKSSTNNWTIIRPGITYSKSRFQLVTMEANLFVWRALQGLPVVIPKEILNKYTTMTWAGDVAKLIAELALNKKALGEDFNLVTAEHQKWSTVAEIYQKIIGLKIHLVSTRQYINALGGSFNNYQVKYDRAYNRVLDNSKVLKATGLKQSDFIDLKAGLERELGRFAKNPHFGGIDYEIQARFDKLTGTKINKDILTIEELAIYDSSTSISMTKLRKSLRPRTRLIAFRDLLRPRTRYSETLEKLKYKLEWQKYKGLDGVILTLNGYFNYGNIVQRFALQEYLRQKGHNYTSYENSPTDVSWDHPERFKNTSDFVERNIARKQFDPRDSFKSYIVGSDQVWRNWGYKNERRDLGYFFLDFVENDDAKRIAYAASIGKDTVEEAGLSNDFIEYSKPLVSKFDAIFMREDSGVRAVEDAWGVKSRKVIDPTMLLTAKSYNQLIIKSPHKLKPISPIFQYILASSDSKKSIVNNISNILNKDTSGIVLSETDTLPPVEQWLKGFRDCEFVVTDSFHGTVFALIYNKPFIVIENEVGGVSRIYDLLSEFKLEGRVVAERHSKKFNHKTLMEIDWKNVNYRIDELRRIGGFWLEESIKTDKVKNTDVYQRSVSRGLGRWLVQKIKQGKSLARRIIRTFQKLLPYPLILFLQKVRNKLTTKVVYVENAKSDPELPLISIVTPFYNSSATIGETVQSVLSQTLQDFEYVIVDDGSSVEHAKALDKIKHPKIRIIHLDRNIGNGSPAAARNYGILMTKGKYVVCLDADDTIEPTYLEKCAISLETHPSLGLVSTNTRAFGEINEDWDYTDYNPLDLIRNNMIITAAMFRRSVWEEVGGYKEGIGYEDWELWINMAEHGYYAYRLKDRLFNYRTAQNSRFIDDRKKHEENLATIYGLHPNYRSMVRRAYRKSRRRAYRVVPQSALGSLAEADLYAKVDNTKPNVLVAMPWMTFGGAETLIVNFCNEIKDSFNISFITGLESRHEWEDKFKDITTNIYHLSNLFDDRKLYVEFVSNYINTRNIDILHIVHTNFMSEFIEELKSRHPNLKIILTVFNDRAHLNESIEASDFVNEYTTDNNAVQRRYLHELSKKGADNPVRVIPNGINSVDIFNPSIHDRTAQRNELGLTNNDLAIFFVGRLSEEKNPDVFVESANKTLEQKQENVKFFIIGDGPMRQKIEQQIKKSDRNSKIVYLGYQSDIAKYLSAADVFVLPSSIEGFPLSILEAMAMKTAVIASDVGAVSDVIKSSVDGFVVTPGSSEEIAEKIILLSKDRDLLSRIQKESREKVEQKYSNEILRKNYKQLYQDVLK